MKKWRDQIVVSLKSSLAPLFLMYTHYSLKIRLVGGSTIAQAASLASRKSWAVHQHKVALGGHNWGYGEYLGGGLGQATKLQYGDLNHTKQHRSSTITCGIIQQN